MTRSSNNLLRWHTISFSIGGVIDFDTNLVLGPSFAPGIGIVVKIVLFLDSLT